MRTHKFQETEKAALSILRSTGADIFEGHFRSFAELQLEIGHRDATLLRTRYVDQRGVQAAAQFWNAA